LTYFEFIKHPMMMSAESNEQGFPIVGMFELREGDCGAYLGQVGPASPSLWDCPNRMHFEHLIGGNPNST